MGDDCETFARAWIEVMGPPSHRLLCVRHLYRSWRKKLPKINGSYEVKPNIYKTLRVLLETRDQKTFHELMSQFLESKS